MVKQWGRVTCPFASGPAAKVKRIPAKRQAMSCAGVHSSHEQEFRLSKLASEVVAVSTSTDFRVSLSVCCFVAELGSLAT